MNSYKIGNQANCVFRSFVPGTIGGMVMQYDGQPYTEVKDIEASFYFSDASTEATTPISLAAASQGVYFNEVRLKNCPLTEKILNLVFNKSDVAMMSCSENVRSDGDGYCYLSTTNPAYQVFVYDVNGKLVDAAGRIWDGFIGRLTPNENYIVYYYKEVAKALSLDRKKSIYMSADITTIGNIGDSTRKFSFHIAKCNVEIYRNINLNGNNANTIDLTLKIITPTPEEIAAGKENFVVIDSTEVEVEAGRE